MATETKFKAPIIVMACAAVVAGLLYWYLQRPAPPPAQPVLTAEAKAYVRRLQLSEVGRKATDSYMGHRLVEITGKITNAGDRAVSLIEIYCVFYDPYGQLVLRQRVPIVSARMGGLKPGETKSFRLPFDAIPASWNQALPQLVIAQIKFS